MYSRIMCNVLAVSRYLKSTPARLMPGLALFANRLGCRNVSNKIPAHFCFLNAMHLLQPHDYLSGKGDLTMAFVIPRVSQVHAKA
jgi:hypothetical protein